MKLKFTKKNIQSRAYGGVYGRGVEYYKSNSVGEIKLENGKYLAYVHGNERYSTSYNPNNDRFSCTCPYDGFCKHSVAFGLKLLDNLNDLQKYKKTFTDFLSSADNNLKLEFLKKILLENSKLRNEFEKFHKFETNQFDEVEINDVAEDIYSRINFYDHEDIYDEAPRGYYEEPYETAGRIVEDLLSEYEEELKQYADNKLYNDVFKYMSGINIGLMKSEDTILGEHTGDIIEYAYEANKIFEKAIKQTTIHERKQIISLLFHEVENHKELQNWYLHNSLFNIFVVEKELAIILKEKLHKYSSDKSTLDIFRKIEKTLGNKDTIKRMAKQNPDDYNLAIDYLSILKKEKKYDKIKKVLYYWLNTSHWDISKLEPFITPELGNEDYKTLLEACLLKCLEFKTYKKLRKLIGENSAKKIRNKIKSNDLSHQINLHEKWYDDVLQFINKNMGSYYFNYRSYLKDIEHIFPDEAWEVHKKYINKQIKAQGKNRNTYKEIADILKCMQKINLQKSQAITSNLYNHVPRLPALKDEFEKAGLV